MFHLKKKEYAPTIDAETIASMPLTLFEGKITVIDELGEEYDKAVRYLRRHRVIGFDTETRPVFTPHAPQNGVALLQLSSGRRAFLFRVHRIGLEDSLAAILADPKIIKVGAAVHDDIRGLQKIFPFKADGFVDLQRICGQWGIQDKSVKKLTAIVMGRRISKTQQLSNWEAQKLSDAQKIYAATDAWICREMYFRLLASPKPKEQMEAGDSSKKPGEAPTG